MKAGLLFCGLIVIGISVMWAAPAAPSLAAAGAALQGVPPWFEPNLGLYGANVKYYSRGAGYSVVLDKSGAVLSFADGAARAQMRLALAGGNPRPGVQAAGRLPGRTNYLLGNQPGKWKGDVPHYARVHYSNVYPGIDVTYFGSGRRLEYDFIVSPGVDPGLIRMRFEGADYLRLDREGSLRVGIGGRELVQPKPVVYQEKAGRRQTIEGRYTVARNREVRFAVGRYDRETPLVIDPVLVYAGYVGGTTYDVPTGMSVDRDGNVWLVGTTSSAIELPEQNQPHTSALVGNYDIFVAKLGIPSSGPAKLLYFGYLGGIGNDWGGQIALDADGNVYLTGSTVSTDFPKTANAMQEKLGGPGNTASDFNQDAVAVKLNPAASGTDSLVFSTFIGGSKTETPTALALDRDRMMLVAGYTSSIDISPMVADGLQPANRGGYDAFLFKIDPNAAAGQALKFNTYFGGNSTEVATGMAIDASGAVYLCGYSYSEQDLPVAGGALPSNLGLGGDGFIVKLDLTKPGLDKLVYASYLGGAGLDIPLAMTLDASGGVWLTGYTTSKDFPVTPDAFQMQTGGASDVFLARLDLTVPSITYSTYFGGASTDIAYSLALAGPGQPVIAGYSYSNNLPLKGALPAGEKRIFGADAFVAILDTALAGADALAYSTYFGGGGNDVATAIVPLPSGSIYVSGYSSSRNLPVTDGSAKPSPSGSTSGFLLRLDQLPEPQQ